MNALSLFSGIGGLDLAAEWAGFKTVAFCERDKFFQNVLAKHWPEVKIYDDVRTLDGSELPAIDLLHGGIPCQPFSQLGAKRMEPIDKLVAFVDELTGSCPYDVFDWQVKGGCADMCGTGGRGEGECSKVCWKEWALETPN